MIIGIEGGVGAGKTTLVANLGVQLPDSHIVKEYFDLISPNSHARVLSMSEEDKLDLFLRLERQRLDSLKSVAASTIILDRSFLTLLSYQYATLQYDKLPNNVLTKSYAKENFVLPDAIVHLDIDDTMRVDRVVARGSGTLPLLLEPEFNSRTRSFLAYSGKAVPYMYLNTSGMDEKDMTDFVLQFIRILPVQRLDKAQQYSKRLTLAGIQLGSGPDSLPGAVPSPS